MKRRVWVIAAVCLIIMALGCAAAYAEQGGIASEPTAIETNEQKDEASITKAETQNTAPAQAEATEEASAPDSESTASTVPEEDIPAPEEVPVEGEAETEAPAAEDGPNAPEEADQDAPAPQAGTPDQPEAFDGSVSVKLSGDGELAYGDPVTLLATVKGAANIEYALRWEVNDGSGWKTINGETERAYTFTLTEQNAGYQWRVVVITEA